MPSSSLDHPKAPDAKNNRPGQKEDVSGKNIKARTLWLTGAATTSFPI